MILLGLLLQQILNRANIVVKKENLQKVSETKSLRIILHFNLRWKTFKLTFKESICRTKNFTCPSIFYWLHKKLLIHMPNVNLTDIKVISEISTVRECIDYSLTRIRVYFSFLY